MRKLPEAAGPDDDVVELRSRVPMSGAGSCLLEYLLARFPYHDRTSWQAEIRAGRLLVDGVRAGARTPLRARAEVCYRKLHREPPVDRAVQIVHTEPALVVVIKPAHLPVHADGPFLRHTLIHLLRFEYGLEDARLTHRLDRETSGLMVVARSRDARAALERQFAAGEVDKGYLAVVHGQPPAVFDCRAPIGHAAQSAIALRRSAAPDARAPRPASTDFEVELRGPGRALVHCRPHTGRTHQIRVHLEHCGFPIVGDRLYGRPDEDYLAFVRAVKAGADPRELPATGPARQLLHAAKLAFTHPATGARLQFTAAPPAEFTRWLLAP